MERLEAIVLSELLAMPVARQQLLEPDDPDAGADQRRELRPDRLWTRVLDRQATLRPHLDLARTRAEQLLQRTVARGLETLTFGAPGYPVRLAGIADPPPILWLRGQRRVLTRAGVALVGSRAGTSYSREVAAWLGSELAARGFSVISGLARGVDGAAHRGGLRGPGSTVAVLGCGLDVCYPGEHAGLGRDIARAGVLLSEYGPSVPPRPWRFPRRNRVISGLAHAVVVVEAGERSGSLITARCAAEQGREVMVVPGNILSGRNRGGHALLKDGAKLVETADDILEEIGWASPGAGATASEEPDADLVLRQMDTGESYDLDALAARSGLGSAELLARLLDLELAGRICRSETGRFSRLRR